MRVEVNRSEAQARCKRSKQLVRVVVDSACVMCQSLPVHFRMAAWAQFGGGVGVADGGYAVVRWCTISRCTLKTGGGGPGESIVRAHHQARR